MLIVEIKGEKKDINGIYFVDEKKFNLLSDEEFLEFCKCGYLVFIYFFLMFIY